MEEQQIRIAEKRFKQNLVLLIVTGEEAAVLTTIKIMEAVVGPQMVIVMEKKALQRR